MPGETSLSRSLYARKCAQGCGRKRGSRCGAKRRRSESNRRIEVLQTSALPLGYGAVRHKLAIYVDFLNPPREVLPTSFKPLSCRTLTVPQSHERPRSPVFSAHSKNTPSAKSRCGDFCG